MAIPVADDAEKRRDHSKESESEANWVLPFVASIQRTEQ